MYKIEDNAAEYLSRKKKLRAGLRAFYPHDSRESFKKFRQGVVMQFATFRDNLKKNHSKKFSRRTINLLCREFLIEAGRTTAFQMSKA
jgi:hypothetical protein